MDFYQNIDLFHLLKFVLVSLVSSYISLKNLLPDGLVVMSVDFGQEYMKTAIVKPGVPMEIVLNRYVCKKCANLKVCSRKTVEKEMEFYPKNPSAEQDANFFS
jgi:hypothetical protein